MWWNTLLRAISGPSKDLASAAPEDKRYKYTFQPEYVRQYPPDVADVESDPRWAQERPTRHLSEQD